MNKWRPSVDQDKPDLHWQPLPQGIGHQPNMQDQIDIQKKKASESNSQFTQLTQ